MVYRFYLGDLLLPIAPSKLDLKINNQNKTITLINQGEVNILKRAKLTDISFEVSIPQVLYPFSMYSDGFKPAQYFLDEIEKLKINREPFQFIVNRTLPDGKMLFDTNMKVSLEDYEIEEDVKEGYDLTIKISLKQYRDYKTKTVIITNNKATISSPRSTENSPAPKKKPKTHKVVKGDSLWKLAKKYYGNGSLHAKIYNANKDKLKNPNALTVGQVLIIPV